MPHRPLAGVLSYVRSLVGVPEAGTLTDAALLRRFRAQRDEAALVTLLQRHGPMVLGVCRQMLPDPHDAEDALQVTFLVLARKAGAIRTRESLAAWLHRVAYRAALKIATARRRRRAHEEEAMKLPRQSAEAPPSERQALHAAVDALPARYRTPVVLCYLQGKTHQEAAEELGWPLGTVNGRLARARDLLHRRLRRQGVTLSAGALIAGAGTSAAAVPPVLVETTTRAVLHFTAGGQLTQETLALVHSVLADLAGVRLRLAVVLLLAVAAVPTGLGLLWPGMPWAPMASERVTAGPTPAGAVAARTDALGDPLPEGALFRLGTLRLQPKERVERLAFVPGGKLLASAEARQFGSQEGIVRLWEAATGREVGHFPADEYDRPFQFTADGRTLVTVRQGNLCLWDVATGKKQREIDGCSFDHFALAPDGMTLVGVTATSVVRRELATGKKLSTWDIPFKDSLTIHGFSPDGAILVTEDGALHFWQAATGKEVSKIPANGDGFVKPAQVALAPGTAIAAVTGDMETVLVWDIAAGKEIGRFKASEGVVRLAFAPDGKSLATCDADRTLHLYDWTSGKELRRMAPCHGPIAISPDGRTVAVGGNQGTFDDRIRLWDTATGWDACPVQGLQRLGGVVVAPDSKTLAVGAGDGVQLYESRSGKLLRELPGRSPLAFSPDGQIIVVQYYDVTPTTDKGRHPGPERIAFQLFAVATGETLGPPTEGGGTAFAWSAGHPSLAITTDGFRALAVVDPTTNRELHRWQGEYVACTPDARWAAIQQDGTIRLLDARTGNERCRLTNCALALKFAGGSRGVIPAFSANGTVLAACGSESSLCLWETATGKELLRVDAEDIRHGPYCLSADGSLFAGSIRKSSALQVWHTATKRLLRTFDRKAKQLYQCCLSADGRLLAEVSHPNHTVRVWEVLTGQEIAAFTEHRQLVSLEFAPDNSFLVTFSFADGTVLAWDLSRNVGGTGNTEPALEKRWAGLADDNAANARRAAWQLRAAPQAVPFLAERLRAAALADPKEVAQLLADLDSQSFEQRRAAAAALERLDTARDQLQKRLAEGPPLEVRRRIEELLASLDDPGHLAGRRRELRCIEVLERIGTADAQQLLKKLAAGAPSAHLTVEAKTALARLRQR